MRSTKVDAGDFKHESLNRLRSTMAVNVLTRDVDLHCAEFVAHIFIFSVVCLRRRLVLAFFFCLVCCLFGFSLVGWLVGWSCG